MGIAMKEVVVKKVVATCEACGKSGFAKISNWPPCHEGDSFVALSGGTEYTTVLVMQPVPTKRSEKEQKYVMKKVLLCDECQRRVKHGAIVLDENLAELAKDSTEGEDKE